MFGAADEDDLEFNPAAGSKLALLFGLEKSPEKGNASLTYTAPKQPKHHTNDDGGQSSKRPSATRGSTPTNASSTSNKLTLICVKVVTSFKLEDGSYNPQGKLGLALLGNSTTKLFQLILYKGKQQHITTVKITPNFQFTVQPHLYATFYDDCTQNWSVMFEKKEDAVEFITQIAVAKYRSANTNEESIITQELLPGTGDSFREGDTVQLELAAQPFTVDSVQAVDPRQSMIRCALSHKLSKGEWDSGLLGASTGSVRAILVPLHTSVPWLSSKRNEPLLIEAHISNIHQEIDSSKEKHTSNEEKLNKSGTAASGVDSAVDSSAEDSSVRARGASIKEALTSSPRSNKASIISRMARMGQATLPLKGAVVCNPSDSEETEEDSGVKPPIKSRQGKSRQISSSHRHQQSSPQTSPGATTVAPTVTVMQTQPMWNQHQQNVMRNVSDGSIVQFMASEGQLVSVSSQQQLPLMSTTNTVMSPTDNTQHMSIFLSEARIQNTEMRMHLSKFSDKIDQLVTKVDNLNVASGPPGLSSAAAVGLEPNVLLSSIEKLVRDNQTLQAEVLEKNKRLDEQNERIFSLLNTNSKFLEQSSSLLEQKQIQDREQQKQEQQQQQQEQQSQLIKQLQEEKSSLGNQLASLQNQLVSVQELVQALQKNNLDLNQELEVTRGRLHEKEATLLKMDSDRLKSSSDDQLFQLNEALDKVKAENLQLKEKILNEQTISKSEKSTTEAQFRTLEQQYKDEINRLKEQIGKQSDQHQKLILNLESKCNELTSKLQDQPKQAVCHSTASAENIITNVKSLMNTLHKGLSQQFVVGQSYEAAQIKSIISSIVKREALQFVSKMEKEYLHQTDFKIEQPSASESETDTCVPESVEHVPASGIMQIKETEKPAEAKLSNESSNKTNLLSMESVLDPTKVGRSPTETIPVSLNTSENANQGADVKHEEVSYDEKSWRPGPPPPPLFQEDDDSDDWLA
ncbi:FK506-binding protein 15 [Frankliniella fusca]|uniref:FK506-binding protein 15 n=1 Tax=Frankliniella fusca TaxID=407009 RepID=A0AAE1LI56_9NEOP|nr:FK506-binding protein 15 [Frankliniella fusca]